MPPSSPHGCLQALRLQWKGSEASLPRQNACAGQREVSVVYISSHPARHLTDIPGAETFRSLKIFGPLHHSLSSYVCAEVIFLFLTESQVYEIQLSSGICHKMKAQSTLIWGCVRRTHDQHFEKRLILFMVEYFQNFITDALTTIISSDFLSKPRISYYST